MAWWVENPFPKLVDGDALCFVLLLLFPGVRVAGGASAPSCSCWPRFLVVRSINVGVEEHIGITSLRRFYLLLPIAEVDV